MSIPKVRKALQRDFLLDLSEGFIYDCLQGKVRPLEMAEYRRWVWEHFRGPLCVDELHLGRYTLLLATDPLGDFAVAFSLVEKHDQPHMERFLSRLKRSGREPDVVITDGSSLYPAVLAELWPEAKHQLCVFHVIKDINEQVLDAVKRMRRELSRRGNRGRKRKRGRPTKGQRAYRKRRKTTLKERANRKLRHYEKVRYKWRRRRSMVRFLLLAIDRWWHERRCDAERPAPTRRQANRQQAKPRSRPTRWRQRRRPRPKRSPTRFPRRASAGRSACSSRKSARR
jgi:transposase-like protein